MKFQKAPRALADLGHVTGVVDGTSTRQIEPCFVSPCFLVPCFIVPCFITVRR
jgi:hypothetical protein